MFAIVVHEKGGAERRELFEGAEISVGRVQGNDLMLPKGNVSKRHARLLYRDGRFIVTDLNSTNGTYVNRRRITQATIVREGDRIYIGDFILRIEPSTAGAEASGTAPAPMPAASMPPAPRQPLQTQGDSQPGATARPSADEEEELTRSPQRSALMRSSPVAASEPSSLGTPAGRSTVSDDDLGLRLAVLEATAALVERVARGLRPEELEGEVSADLVGRIDQTLRDAWSKLSSDRAVPTRVPADRVLALARAELIELGPLGELLSDPEVTDVAIVGADRLTVTRGGRSSMSDSAFSCNLAVRWTIARLGALRAEAGSFAEAGLIERRLSDGSTLSASLVEEAVPVALITRPRRLSGSFDDLVRRGTASRTLATFLQQCLLARLNVLVVGPRDGGVELLLGAFASSIAEREVVYAGPFAGERPTGGADLSGLSTPEAALLAVKAPYVRLFAGLGTPQLTEAVIAGASEGADGIVAARYASSLRRGLLRTLAELRPRYGDGAAEVLAGTFELVVEIARLRDDRHRVLRVAEVLGSEDGELELSDVFTFAIDRTATGGMIEGSFAPAATMPVVADLMRTRGAPIDSALFTRPSSR